MMNLERAFSIGDLREQTKRRLPAFYSRPSRVALKTSAGSRATRRHFKAIVCCPAISWMCPSEINRYDCLTPNFVVALRYFPTGIAGVFRRDAELMLAQVPPKRIFRLSSPGHRWQASKASRVLRHNEHGTRFILRVTRPSPNVRSSARTMRAVQRWCLPWTRRSSPSVNATCAMGWDCRSVRRYRFCLRHSPTQSGYSNICDTVACR